MTREKRIWFGIDDATPLHVLEKTFNLNYTTVFLPLALRERIAGIILPQRMDLAVLIGSEKEIAQVLDDPAMGPKTGVLVARDPGLVDRIRQTGKVKAGLFLNVSDKKTLDNAVAWSARVDLLLIEFKDPTNIPLELILATTQATGVSVFKMVRTAEDGTASFMTMEKGSDGILLRSNDIEEVMKLDRAFTDAGLEHLTMREAVVTRVRHTGMGDRVCVDTTSELFQDEGMILGSTSDGGIVTCSETHHLPYMNLRPFRVNAGGLHLYVWGPHNKAYYLSDLRAGDTVWVVNAAGRARVVTIGRLKIERRPLFCVEAEIDGTRINTFIQDDWHVRLMGSKGEIRPSSEIAVGDRLLGYLDKSGRHVGIKIEEKIKEL